MTTLESGFEDALLEQVLDDHETWLREERIPQAIDVSHGILESYGSRHGYNVDPIIDSLREPEIERTQNGLTASWGWEHQAAPFFNTGTTFTNPVEGDPILAFEWPEAPPDVREDFEDTFPTVFFHQTEPTGLPGSGFVRAGVNWLTSNL